MASPELSSRTVSIDNALTRSVGEVMIRQPKTLPADAPVSAVRREFERPSVRTVLLAKRQRFAGAIERDGLPADATVLTNTNPSMMVEREEIFGPVVCAIPFESPEEIVPVANDTNDGLAAGVFTRDISKAHRTAKRLRAGTVWISTYHVFDAAMPFGGYKESGWGREMGSQVLNNYLETKSVVTAL